jgi:predicted PurR-regulated permease PerM
MDKTTNRLLKVVLTVALAGAFFWATGQVFFVVFAGVLVAVFFDALVRAVQFFGIETREWAATVTLLGVLLLITLFVWLGYGVLSEQFNTLLATTPDSLTQLKRQFAGWPRMQELIGQAAKIDYQGLISSDTTFLATVLTGGATLTVIFFIGVYVAFEPNLYRRGILALFPEKHTTRIEGILEDSESYLRWWLVGKFISMTFIGLITIVGMWGLGVPLPILLGVIAAVLTFVPNVGPVISAVPAILLGLTQSPETALYVIVFYLLVQIVESYILTPFIERKAVYLPPALTLSAQIILGIWFGLVGVAVAAPLVVVAMVFVDSLYTHQGVYESG